VPVANKDKVTMFIGAGVLQSAVIPKTTPYVFESSELFTDTIAAMAGYAKLKGWTKVGLLYFQGTDATEANTIVQQYLPSVGMQIVTTQYLPFSTGTLDYTSEVDAAVTGGAQVIFELEGPSGFIAVHQAEQSLGANIPVLGNPAGLNASVYTAFGSSFYAADSPWYLNPTAPGWHAMATALKTDYFITSNNVTADDVGGWVDGEIFKAALEKCGTPKVCTRAKFRLALQGLKNVTFGGLMAPVSFSATDHYAPTETEFFSVGSNGALGAIDNPIPYPVKGQ
jgi:ABC-type branched-subunit amino acid transport system substrate-binding protein